MLFENFYLRIFIFRPSALTLLLHPSTEDDDPSLKYVCLNLRLEIPEEVGRFFKVV